jgi:hypothetical protein
MAPEVISNKKNKEVNVDKGKRADVYSFAMVMFEVGLTFVPKSGTVPRRLTPCPRS